ncbi:MAG: hypothetical protein HDS69_09710 [Bacteroidales bacterium]|nr:hypothetical protein [Bacteroidales bacterium]MBD5259007.1 hypothetical protein [Barnesiella sp.]
MKKTVLMLLVPIVAVAAVLLFCKFPTPHDVNGEIAKVNKDCPVSNDDYVTLESVTYDDSAKVATYNLTIHEKNVGKEYLVNAVNWLKSYDWPRMLSEEGKLTEVVKALSYEGGALAFVYTGDVSGVSVTFGLGPDEILELSETPSTMEQRVERSVNFINVLSNAQFPAEVLPGMAVVRGFDDGDNIVFLCKVDETVHDMDSIERVIPEMKDKLRARLSSNSAGAYLHDINHGITCRYRGVPSDRAVEFTLTAPELAQ